LNALFAHRVDATPSRVASNLEVSRFGDAIKAPIEKIVKTSAEFSAIAKEIRLGKREGKPVPDHNFDVAFDESPIQPCWICIS
jgi:hypothetical protein